MQLLQFGEECVSQRNTIFWGMAALQGPHGDHHLLITTSPGYEVRAHQSCCLSSRLVTTMPTCLQLPLQTDNYALLPEIPAEAAGIVSFYTFSNPAPGEYASMQLKWCPEVMLTAKGSQLTPLPRHLCSSTKCCLRPGQVANAMQFPAEADLAKQQLEAVQRSQPGLRVMHLRPTRLCLARRMCMQTCEGKRLAKRSLSSAALTPAFCAPGKGRASHP